MDMGIVQVANYGQGGFRPKPLKFLQTSLFMDGLQRVVLFMKGFCSFLFPGLDLIEVDDVVLQESVADVLHELEVLLL